MDTSACQSNRGLIISKRKVEGGKNRENFCNMASFMGSK